MRDTKQDYLFIGSHAYQKTTLLLDVELIEILQRNKESTPSEQINEILREALIDGE